MKGFSDHANWKVILDQEAGKNERVNKASYVAAPTEEKYEIWPEEYASMAVV